MKNLLRFPLLIALGYACVVFGACYALGEVIFKKH